MVAVCLAMSIQLALVGAVVLMRVRQVPYRELEDQIRHYEPAREASKERLLPRAIENHEPQSREAVDRRPRIGIRLEPPRGGGRGPAAGREGLWGTKAVS
ncbi:MAG: hypothetical protein IPK13_08780 [Deltaproteobacteria bacterium]|nr:hypothetical protein [Deltaproteobacteria bacterium]